MIALVTGANKGIGHEVARQLAEQGHTVFLGSRDLKKGEEALAKLSDPKNMEVVQLDVTDSVSIQNCLKVIEQKHGRLDILVNNAGVNYDTWQNVVNADLSNVKETFDTNLFGVWEMIQTFLPLMQKNGYGRIVNVSSGAGAWSSQTGGTPGYSLSKIALNALTVQFNNHILTEDILINAVCPGWVRTDMGGSSATRSVAEGAETIVWLSQLPSGGPSGKFFRDKEVIDW